jgi:ABC-type cobalamin/Fe3+-siderophores transport system ATPase subunit
MISETGPEMKWQAACGNPTATIRVVKADLLSTPVLKNFKSFADATLKVGGLTVVVGANASGKSNLRDGFDR